MFNIAKIALITVLIFFDGDQPSFFPLRSGSTKAKQMFRLPGYSSGLGQKFGCQIAVCRRTNGGE